MKKNLFSLMSLSILMACVSVLPVSCRKDNAGKAENTTKDEVDSVINHQQIYGIKWEDGNPDDLGQRCFNAVGKTATIGIGNTDGSSDFDNIYPWSEIKRCNITLNAYGTKMITFEGEGGFALDGSNGDVFVRIPKFKVKKYKEGGYEYRTISETVGETHPAFIEDGKELKEIFIGAFEASKDGLPYTETEGSKLYSRGGVIPANNITAQTFLNYARAKGVQYSLYDMRCVDVVWLLMAVEYGCRNSNRVFGYGYSDYIQAATYQAWSIVTVASESTNSVTFGTPRNNSERLFILNCLAAGNNICICQGSQENIIAERKITEISCPSASDNVVITFDGEPISVDATCFAGNAAITCNNCELITDSGAALNWHTGRTARSFLAGAGHVAETLNSCRYRWIENPVGNVWHFLPDVTFNNLQMYVCDNMRNYEAHKIDGDYHPVGDVLPVQSSNGHKSDINTVDNPNFWVTSLLNDYFGKGIALGKSFDEVHDGRYVSTKGFGAYYYLNTGRRIISNGGGFDHLWRCNILTQRAWQADDQRWYLYGARLMFKDIN